MPKHFKPKQFSDKKKEVVVFHGLCKGCGLCIEKCPVKAIAFSKKDLGVYYSPAVKIEIAKCTTCKICELTCPDSAIRVDKKK